MSKYRCKTAKTIQHIKKFRDTGKKLTMLTCYDAVFGKVMEESPLDMVLVGDSLGNVMMGLEDTTQVTMSHMIHHTRAVANVLQGPLLVADMPFMSYSTRRLAIENAGRLVQEGGAQAVKLEGGCGKVLDYIEAIVSLGIPVMGHIGLTPQKIHQLGGYRVQGKSSALAEALKKEAGDLAEVGCFAIVLELVTKELAAEVTDALAIPTIGIGAGSNTDGQVLVLHDMLGFDGGFQPKFVRRYADLQSVVAQAVQAYTDDVQSGAFPSPEESFTTQT